MNTTNGSSPHPFQSWDAELALSTIRGLAHLPGALLPMLHALQDSFGYVDEAAIPLLAETLNLSRAEVVGVINFYHDFRTAPPGRHHLRICRAEACQSMGVEALVAHIEQARDLRIGETTPDAALTVEAVYCLGNCALAPSVMFDGRLHGRASADLVDRLIDAARLPS